MHWKEWRLKSGPRHLATDLASELEMAVACLRDTVEYITLHDSLQYTCSGDHKNNTAARSRHLPLSRLTRWKVTDSLGHGVRRRLTQLRRQAHP